MKHRSSTTALVCAMLACLVVTREVAAADPDRVAEGRAHFSRGVEYFKDEDFRNAMMEFKRAYELAPNYKLLYNLGQTAQELKDYAFALKTLEQYLAEGGNEIVADRRTEVSATIRKLKQRVAEVTVTANVNDAEVLVDDVPVGRTPLSSPLAVSAGSRKITVTKGSMTTTRMIDVAGGERTELALELSARSSDSAAPGAIGGTQRAEGKPGSVRHASTSAAGKDHEDVGAATTATRQENEGGNPTWIGVVATSVLAVATGVTGGLALAAKRDFDSTIDRYPIKPSDVSAARDKTRNLALVTDILGGATLLSCGVTIWIAVAHGRNSKTDAKPLAITVAPNGLIAHGSF